MKLWVIKIGKAFSAIRQEGVVRGGSRVIKSFLALFRRVGRGDILFVTGGLGDSARYRTEHVAEMLALAGLKSSVTVQDNPFLSRYVDRFSIFIFQRTLYTRAIEKMIQHIKVAGKEIIFETDDLVYDPKYLEYMDIFKKMNSFEKKQYEKGVGGEILADSCVKVCTTSTAYLAQKLREIEKRVFIILNQLSMQDVSWAETLRSTTKDKHDFVQIAYFSGTKSHDKDFEVVAPVLATLMRKHPNVRLLLAGPLKTGLALEPFEDRISRFPYVDRRLHFKNIHATDINIAPLEVGNPFCESKSELKFFEAGILGIPTVASSTQTFCQAIEDGVDGFLAKDQKEWEEKIERLVLDDNLRREMGERSRQKVLSRYVTTQCPNTEYVDYLKSCLRK